MPSEIISTVSAVGDTFEASQTEVLLTAVATFSKGECVLCVLDADGRYTTCVAPTAASLGTVASAICSNGTFGIILEDVIGTATVPATARVCVRGQVQAIVLSTSDASLVQDGHLVPNTSKQLEYDLTGLFNMKLVGQVTASVTGGGGATSTPTLRTVFFNGREGFGRFGGTAS